MPHSNNPAPHANKGYLNIAKKRLLLIVSLFFIAGVMAGLLLLIPLSKIFVPKDRYVMVDSSVVEPDTEQSSMLIKDDDYRSDELPSDIKFSNEYSKLVTVDDIDTSIENPPTNKKEGK